MNLDPSHQKIGIKQGRNHRSVLKDAVMSNVEESIVSKGQRRGHRLIPPAGGKLSYCSHRSLASWLLIASY